MSSPASRWIDMQMQAALDRVFSRIDQYQREGHCTEDDVTDALDRGWGEPVADGWREYIRELEA